MIKMKDKKEEKIIFVWPEGVIPKISQEELINYSSLFENRFNKNHLLIILLRIYLINLKR